jgi:UDP-2-acetamido-2,6-beta-L-arabino-hexul-4-ose reductase
VAIVVTGAKGFIARNLCARLRECGHTDVVGVTRSTCSDELQAAFGGADIVFHLAGINRPEDVGEFESGNTGFTRDLCDALARSGRSVPVVFTSSTQAALDNPYGRSKCEAENILVRYGDATGAPVWLFRLTNVFGKWSRPNYNSAVATFCYNIARDLPITVHNPAARLSLLYIDDVVDALLQRLDQPLGASGFLDVHPVYETSVGELADILRAFRASRSSLVTLPVGQGLFRALHATYLSFLPAEAFAYRVPLHTDPRGEFAEMLKTEDSGQLSYFTAHPGITRGGHYHHTKAEKFLVVRGTAHFGFRNVDTGQTMELVTRGGEARIVETVPGWAHDITNIGDDELVVMLWANEVFDRARPDTIASPLRP